MMGEAVDGKNRDSPFQRELYVDKGRCVGSTTCIHIAPEVFELDENGQSAVIDALAAPRSDVEDAIASCPTEAIGWRSDERMGDQ